MAFDFMEKLLATDIGNCWPHFTNSFVVSKNSDGEVSFKKKYQTNHKHTEIQMLNDKEFQGEVEKGKADKTKKTKKTENTDKTEKVDIILTSNYSPCWECADKLKKFYEDNKSLIRKFTIRFSRLYRIEKKGETKKEKPNRSGLKDLFNAGFTLEAMTEKSWFDVLTTERSWSNSMAVGKSSLEKMMKEKDFDQVTKLFGLDPKKVRKRDAAASEGLEELEIEALEDKMKENL